MIEHIVSLMDIVEVHNQRCLIQQLIILKGRYTDICSIHITNV